MKTVLITGANSGLGFETAKKIAKDKDFRVILACRNPQKAEQAKNDIIASTGNENVETVALDTSSLASVRTCAREVLEKYGAVDVLINNAGISPMHSGMTEDGFELVFETNYLGHFLLTELLLPSMKEGARIFNVSSDQHDPPGGISWPGVEELAHPGEEDRRKYSYSKLCMIYFTHSLARQLEKEGKQVCVNSFNPGFMSATNFSGGTGAGRDEQIRTTMPERYGTLEDSSNALAQLATDPAFDNITNEYFDRSTNTKASSELSYNRANEDELFEKSREYTGLAV